MKIIDKELFLEFGDMEDAGFNADTLKQAKARNSSSWNVIKDPDDGRKSLYGYEQLKGNYKKQVQNWLRKQSGCKHEDSEQCNCGDPYAHLALEPIRKMIRRDDKAEDFYLKHTYSGPTGKDTLPAPAIEKYTRQASLLNMLIRARADKKGIKQQFGINIDAFHDLVIEVICKDGYELPATYRNLTATLRKYEDNGYSALISPRFGNQNSAKVKKGEVAEDLLLELLNHPNQFDDLYISLAYNKQIATMGYEPITASTVTKWRQKKGHLLKAGREGWADFRQEFARNVRGFRPSQPGYLWESDDNHVDLLFMGDDKSPYHRAKALFVTDSHCDLVLGKAIIMDGDMPTDLVRMAYIDAMYYVRHLTGGWHLPWEVKTDRWRLKSLRPFYEGMGHYYDTPVASKNRGYIENFFGCTDWKRCLKIDAEGVPAINYQGNNVLAKNRGFNTEMARINQKLYPHVMEAQDQIDAFVHRLRHIDLEGVGSREQQWLESWARMPESERRPITDEQFLLKFGLQHITKNGSRNSISKDGIEITIAGRKLNYAVPPALYLQNVGKKVDVFFDPYDLNRVLVTDGATLRFVAPSMALMPRSMRDMQLAGEGARAFLNQVLQEKADDVQTVVNATDKRRASLQQADIDMESVLRLGGGMVKEIKQAAELAHIQTHRNYNALDQM